MYFIKKIILFISNLFNYSYNVFLFKYRNVGYLKFPHINGRIVINGRGKIIIGNNVRINSSMLSNPIGGDTKTILSADEGAVIEIGDNTGISNSAIVCKNRIIIGNNVKIGGGVKIYDTDFHSIIYEERISIENDIPQNRSIEIKQGSFIGAFSIILKGVTIGEKSIIGAGSIVTKDIPDGEIWAGNPAKFIKQLDN